MATNQLTIYNIAIASVGERVLTSIDENREIRRQLDTFWNAGSTVATGSTTIGVKNYLLRQGLWNFAMRESSSTASGSTGGFNYANQHSVPTDYVRLSAISADPNFSVPLTRYEIRSTSIFTDEQTIYLRYVSNSSTAGTNYELWPYNFSLWAGHWLGVQVAPFAWGDANPDKATKNISEREGMTRKLDALKKREHSLLVDARSKDAMEEPPRFLPQGSWVSARHGRAGGRRDGGSRNSLTG